MILRSPGVWKSLYRTIDKQEKTVDFMLTAKRKMVAVKRFFEKSMGANGDPNKVTIDKSGAKKALDAINSGRDVSILMYQVNISTTSSSRTIAPSSG